MKKLFYLLGLSLLAFGASAAGPETSDAVAQEALTSVPTVAVLPFTERNAKARDEDIGGAIADLLTAELLSSGKFDTVERNELNKVLDELQLSQSGLVSSETQLRIGQLVGAKVIVTGSVIRSNNQNFVVAKAIGAETGQVLAASVKGNLEPVELVPQLSEKLEKVLDDNLDRILPKAVNSLELAGRLAEKVKGNGRKVYISVQEDIQAEAKDPAVDTELKHLFQLLGFALTDREREADLVVTGEGQAVHAGSYRQFTSATARVELTIKAKDKILAVDRQVETLAGNNYPITAKNALAQAALKLMARMLQQLP